MAVRFLCSVRLFAVLPKVKVEYLGLWFTFLRQTQNGNGLLRDEHGYSFQIPMDSIVCVRCSRTELSIYRTYYQYYEDQFIRSASSRS